MQIFVIVRMVLVYDVSRTNQRTICLEKGTLNNVPFFLDIPYKKAIIE